MLKKNLVKDLKKIDYLILACLVNNNESEEDILDMVQRFVCLRLISDNIHPFAIHNPPSETK